MMGTSPAENFCWAGSFRGAPGGVCFVVCEPIRMVKSSETERKERLEKSGEIIREQLITRKYEPKPVRRVEIQKPDGGIRNLPENPIDKIINLE